MNLNSKIYVAGHTGLVGSSILKKLKSLGYKNLITASFSDVDLRRQKDVEEFFEKHKPEYVFLAAAKVGGILANSSYQAEFIYDNLMIATNIIHSSYKYGVKKLLNLGSSCIYPKNAPQPLKEDYLLSDYLEPTNEPYAIAKIAAIKLCRYYNEQYGTNFISVMPTNLYGVNDNFNLKTSHVLPALIRKFHLAKLLSNKDFINIKNDLNSNPIGYNIDEEDIESSLKKIGIEKNKIVLWGSGNVFREFMYVDDLVDAVMLLMNRYDYCDVGEIINIGTGHDVTIRELSFLIKEVIGFDGEIEFGTAFMDGTPRKLLDVSKIESLGWKYKVSLKQGLRKAYTAYLNKRVVLTESVKDKEGLLKC